MKAARESITAVGARSALRLYFVRDDNAEMRDRREIKAPAEGIVFMINTDTSCSLDDPH